MRIFKGYHYIAWGLAGLFFMVHYIIRVAPQEMIDILQQDFSMSMSHITIMQSAFFLSYILMQVPAGILIDRYPPHRVLQGAASAVLLSSLLFYVADAFWQLLASRILLGLGSAFAFSGSVKMATLWFPRKYLGVLTSLTQVLGMIGAASQSLIDNLLLVVHWREAVGYFTGMIFVLWGLMFLIWREHPNAKIIEHTRSSSLKDVMSDFVEAMQNKQTWLVSLYAGFIFAPTLVFGESIGLKYVDIAMAHTSVHEGTILISVLFAGFSMGGILQGIVSDMISARRPNIIVSAVGSLITFSVFLYIDASFYVYCALIFTYGLFNSGLVIGYALAGEINPRRISGAGIAFANMMSVLMGTFILFVMGHVLAHFESEGWNMVMGYESSFLILPLSLCMALFLVLFIQESHCRSVDERL